MCTTRSPKPVPVQSADKKEKRVHVLRNPYLDGIEPQRRAQQLGVGSFRIDRGGPNPSGTARIARPSAPSATPPATPSSPPRPPQMELLMAMTGPGALAAYRKLQIQRTPA